MGRKPAIQKSKHSNNFVIRFTDAERAALQAVLGRRMLAGERTSASEIVREALLHLPGYREALEAHSGEG